MPEVLVSAPALRRGLLAWYRRRARALPDVSYVLAFSPQNLKFAGSFHPLKVTLIKAKGLTVQVRCHAKKWRT